MRKLAQWTVLALLLIVGAVRADTVQIQLTGTSRNVSYGYYIDPYYGTVAGAANTTLWCLDFAHSVRIGDVWTASVTLLTSPDISATYYDDANKYAQAAYLFSIYSDKSLEEQKQIQWAVWNLFYPSAPDYYDSTYAYWRGLAQTAVNEQRVDLTAWRVLTDVAGVKQEFLQQVPEPATLTLFGTGLIALGTLVRRRKRV